MALIQYHAPSSPPKTEEAAERGVDALLHKSQENVRSAYHDVEDYVKSHPGAAVLSAVAVGFVLRRLPLGAILSAQVRLLSAVAPPAIFLLGAAKLYETLQTSSKKQ